MPVFAARYIVSGGGVVDTSDAAAMREALGLGSASTVASTAFAAVSPATSTANTIQPANATSGNLILKARASQTAALLELHSSGGTVLLSTGTNAGVTISPPAHVTALTLDVPHTSTVPRMEAFTPLAMASLAIISGVQAVVAKAMPTMAKRPTVRWIALRLRRTFDCGSVGAAVSVVAGLVTLGGSLIGGPVPTGVGAGTRRSGWALRRRPPEDPVSADATGFGRATDCRIRNGNATRDTSS